jgi:Poly-adenylate binding protein, unique domain
MWSYKNGEKWIQVDEDVESEFQAYLKGKRCGQRVYHCFGNKWSAIIDFDTMQTMCGSGRCMLSHQRNGLGEDHMTYELRRVDKQVLGEQLYILVRELNQKHSGKITGILLDEADDDNTYLELFDNPDALKKKVDEIAETLAYLD